MDSVNASDLLLEWFKVNKRKFPWRNSSNPYEILVAEKLLQQTAVGERVISTYKKIIDEFPTLLDLAYADEFKISLLFNKLGLNYRAKELICLSRFIVGEFQGSIPADRDLLLSVPGIGEYIARAVLSFGFNLDYAIVDTNVSRFLFRFLGLSGEHPQNPARNMQLIFLAQSLLPQGNSKDYNYSVLDLCAKVCLTTNPECNICPLQKICKNNNTKAILGENIGTDFTL